MPNVTETVKLLSRGLYKTIPNELTLKTMPTISELDYVGAEEFDRVMLDKILPECVEEKGLDFNELLQVDFDWICRCLRFLNYGSYHTTNSIYCSKCGVTYGEYIVDLRTVDVKPLPDKFTNKIVITKDEFIDFNEDVEVRLPTMREVLQFEKDEAFKKSDGTINTELARLCYMIKKVGKDTNLTPIDVRIKIEKEFSPADYRLLKDCVLTMTDYGMRAGGTCQCPKCKEMTGTFLALSDDRFFRPSVGALRKWKDSKDSDRGNKDVSADTSTDV